MHRKEPLIPLEKISANLPNVSKKEKREVKEGLPALSTSRQTLDLSRLLHTWLSCGELPEAPTIVVEKDISGASATTNLSRTSLSSWSVAVYINLVSLL